MLLALFACDEVDDGDVLYGVTGREEAPAADASVVHESPLVDCPERARVDVEFPVEWTEEVGAGPYHVEVEAEPVYSGPLRRIGVRVLDERVAGRPHEVCVSPTSGATHCCTVLVMP